MRTLILCSLLLLAFDCQSAPQYDVVITGGTPLDGTGAAPRDAGVGVMEVHRGVKTFLRWIN